MTLVEGVGGELGPVGPYLLQRRLVVAVLGPPVEELHLEGGHLVRQLLPHRLTELVALPSGEVGDLTREEHHLLLIDGDAVGILEVALHAGQVIGDVLASVLAVDEVGDVVHRPRAVEGIHRDEVLEGRGLQLAQVLLHAGGLELEGPHRLALGVELVGLGVVDGDAVDVDL